jgi:sugar lactone lactonase YvrE
MTKLTALGEGLHRPECVCPGANGQLFVPNWSGGVAVIDCGGRTTTHLAEKSPIELRPNGVAFTPDGDLLLANLGPDGGVWRFNEEGELTPVLVEFDGKPLPPTNFAVVDAEGRTWVSVSTHQVPRQHAWRPHVRDGFVMVVDQGTPRVAAEGLHYTNEVRPDPSGHWLYVVETFGQRLVRFEILSGSRLGSPQLVVQFDSTFFPDGFAFDQEGAIWVTSLIGNRVVRVNPDGSVTDVIEEVNEAFVANAVASFAAGFMDVRHLGPIPGVRLQHITSIAFGGDDGRTAYLGSLHGTCAYSFRVDVPGVSVPFAGAAKTWPLRNETTDSR